MTFKQAVNEAIRAGMTGGADRRSVDLPAYDMGEPPVDVTKALRLAGELEDQDDRRVVRPRLRALRRRALARPGVS